MDADLYEDAIEEFLEARGHNSAARGFVREFHTDWRHSSLEDTSQRTNRTLARVFGKDPDTEYLPKGADRTKDFINRDELRALTDAKAFNEEAFELAFGKREITVYRGFNPFKTEGKQLIKNTNDAVKQGYAVEMGENTLSSWSWSKKVADDFATRDGLVFRRTIRAEDILHLEQEAGEAEAVILRSSRFSAFSKADILALRALLGDSVERAKQVLIEPDAILEFSDWLHQKN